MKWGSLCSGIETPQLAFEGWEHIFSAETDLNCIRLLQEKYPEVPNLGDIKHLDKFKPYKPDLIIAGDPCQIRSRAKLKPSKMPDLSGYVLAIIGTCRPEWVVRENVYNPDVAEFELGLNLLGYNTIITEFDSKDFTRQSRKRLYCIGTLGHAATEIELAISQQKGYSGISSKKREEESASISCIVARNSRYTAEETYIYEEGLGLRILSCEERESFQGIPKGYTGGFPKSIRNKMIGNAMTVDVLRYIKGVIDYANSH